MLLVVWFVISYGAGILFVEPLNRIRLPGTGFPLGFWFAQQGSIYVFVGLIFVYVFLMNRPRPRVRSRRGRRVIGAR